jgi:hypothetical protein
MPNDVGKKGQRWWEAYRGIPYASRGADRAGCWCWGLAQLIYREQLGIALPAFAGEADEQDRIALAEALGLRGGSWFEVPAGEARVFDLALFEPEGFFHCGVVFNPRRHEFLHVVKDAVSCTERWGSLFWVNRFRGIWRRHDLAA